MHNMIVRTFVTSETVAMHVAYYAAYLNGHKNILFTLLFLDFCNRNKLPILTNVVIAMAIF